jgi:hypothetical protein
MHGSKLSLILWFWAAYLMATHSNGISALQLQRQLGLGSYKTAWLLCAKLRAAMVDPRRNPLTGLVEVDETTIHYRHRQAAAAGGFGRSPKGKLLIAGACEIKGKGPGRLRLAHVADASAASLQGFIAAALALDSTAMTDGWQGYASLPNIIAHQPEVVGTRKAHEVLPAIHRVFSNFKTWALGVYHGLRDKHLQAYLDEFVFRFNRRRARPAAFRSLLLFATRRQPITYNMLIQPELTG